MHEYSIVQALLDQCEEHAKANGASKVTKIVTKIGVLSGVEPHLLETAFNTFKEATMCEDAEFEMQIQPILVRCKSCNKQSEFEKNSIFFECSHCGGVELEVLDGEDMLLMSLELE